MIRPRVPSPSPISSPRDPLEPSTEVNGKANADNITSSTSTAHPAKRVKRSRAVLVCNRCKALKTKCDLGRPCGSCVKAKVVDKCVYEPFRGSISQGASGSGDRRESNGISKVADDGDMDVSPAVSGPGPSTAQHRLSSIESRLAGIESLLTAKISPSHRSFTLQQHSDQDMDEGEEWHYLLSQLPSKDLAKHLLGRFFLADTLFRLTHAPSMRKHFDARYPTAISLEARSTPGDLASFFASLTMTLVIGCLIEQRIDGELRTHQSGPISPSTSAGSPSTTSSVTLADTLSRLYERFLKLSEDLVLSRTPQAKSHETQYYHVLASNLRIERALLHHSSSITEAWLDSGRIRNIALLLEFHVDPAELKSPPTPFWAEMRRRTWVQLDLGDKIITQRLRLPSGGLRSAVRKPTLIADDLLHEDITQDEIDAQGILHIPPHTRIDVELSPSYMNKPVEWAYVECKSNTAHLFSDWQSCLPSSPNQTVNLEAIKRICHMEDQLYRYIPIQFRFETLSDPSARQDHLTGPNRPSWILAQTCVHNLGIAGAVLSTYQPLLSLPVTSSDNAQIIQIAFERSLSAAHRLIVTAEVYVWHITIRWPEGKATFSWNMGSKIFLAGATLALAAIQHGPKHNSWKGWMDDLTSSVGLMNVLVDHTARFQDPSKGETADQKALDILRRLSERAKSPYVFESDRQAKSTRFCDPYTGTATAGVSGDSALPTPQSSTAAQEEDKVIDPYTTREVTAMASPDHPQTQAGPSPLTNQNQPQIQDSYQHPAHHVHLYQSMPFGSTEAPTPRPMSYSDANTGTIMAPGMGAGAGEILPDFGIGQNFSLEDLEALLKEVYGAPQMA
ncbi:hypothetical protein I316_05473 [Kwoniella heveanensis BCC8398]|uniref:Zn(2)-C6 fungal-type domain-containing protein n=1 Tax=Kwoniella heveanensis BCC8398 TaxID=1296120 RepID=A0A1B9GP88_9TREE|nr:hypothetical protein I316_05473 [Kwoniella heveanensis BCC8398]